MKNCPKIKSFICDYLKVDYIESDLKAEDRATERIQNADTKGRKLVVKSHFFYDNTHQVARETFP